MRSRDRKPCISAAAQLRGSPASQTNTARQQRPSTSAADSPAGPAPTITTSQSRSRSGMRGRDARRVPACSLVETPERDAAACAGSLPRAVRLLLLAGGMPRRPRRHSDARLAREARLRFGITAFKPGQRELLDATLAGRDVLGILPTGGGKSLCFQLPALLEARPTVVVSPLIALMRDQEAQLEARDVVAARLDSTLRAGEEREALAAVADGAAELVYCTPERLENPEQLALLREAGVARLVVDEA